MGIRVGMTWLLLLCSVAVSRFELYLVPFPIPQVGKLRPGVEVERNVHIWVGPQGLAGQELTGFGCSLFEQRPLSKCRGRKAVCQPLRAWGQPD